MTRPSHAALLLAASLLVGCATATSTAPQAPATERSVPPTESQSSQPSSIPPRPAEPSVSQVVPSAQETDVESAAPVPAPPESRPTGAAIGDVLVAPTRIVFEGPKRAAEVTLVNVGQSRGTYRITLIDYRMSESGQLEEIDPESNQFSASRLVRFSPRQVTLEPNYMQTVRILLRKPADLPPGEYRSHLLFRSIPEPRPAPDPTQQKPQEGISIELTPIFGISIPLIVRHGELGSEADIENVSVRPPSAGSPGSVLVTVVRKGARSVYGRLRVSFRPDGTGESKVLAVMNGIAVYPPLDRRQVTIPIEGEAAPLPPGQITVTYSDLEGENERVYAEATARVP